METHPRVGIGAERPLPRFSKDRRDDFGDPSPLLLKARKGGGE
jgi:hypothetical protein